MSEEVEVLLKIGNRFYEGKLHPQKVGEHIEIQNNIPDLSMIVWKNAIGDRGPFEVAERVPNKNNASFSRLTEYLSLHDGKATISTYFVWKFSDSSGSIGRKPKV